ncbi:spinster family MFS transporter [Massilia cavernae]|uniref:MFS transporter n=1 Tax=Massilia cavernae TaxID=2320864 RepID=A0A418Y5N1_9BURK|nr:MFS transporter [Massilia cavernae]RJG22068.1 MFS transporter [Massilia cavernae]
MNTISTTAAVASQPQSSRGYRAWLLFVLVMVYASSFIDRIIIAMVGQAIKVDMQLSDLELGLLGGLAFALFYTVLGIPFARLAERYNRVRMIALCTAAWSTMTVLCGFAGNYVQLLLCRAGVGVGEAGCTPAAHSVIADYYPVEKRASALAIFSFGVPIGLLVGSIATGWIVDNYGWRAAFALVGAPGLVIALLVYFTLREPVRGASEKKGYVSGDVPPLSAVLRRLWSKKAFVHVAIGTALVSFSNFAINLFLPVYFVRVFEMSYTQAGLLFGLTTGVASLIGNAAGGFLTDWAGRYNKRWYTWIPGIGFVLAAPLYVAAFMQTSWIATTALLLVGGVLAFLWAGPAFSITQSVVEPRMRASASAILLLNMNLVGHGLGPMFVGFASDAFATRAFTTGTYALECPKGIPMAGASDAIIQACGQASATGIRYAVLTCTCVFLLAGFHYIRAGRYVARDMA